MKTDLKSINTNLIAKNISKILKAKNIKHDSVAGKYQPVVGSDELRFDIKGAVIAFSDGKKKTTLSRLSFVAMPNGEIQATAYAGSRKHLVPFPHVGKIKDFDKLTKPSGIFRDIITFTIDTISDELTDLNETKTRFGTIKKVIRENLDEGMSRLEVTTGSKEEKSLKAALLKFSNKYGEVSMSKVTSGSGDYGNVYGITVDKKHMKGLQLIVAMSLKKHKMSVDGKSVYGGNT